MKMHSANKQEFSKVVLDANGLPKNLLIEPGLYDVEILDERQYKINPRQSVKPKTIRSIEDLINSLCNAAHGYKDCEMSVKKFERLMSAFSCPASNVKMVSLRFKPNVYFTVVI